MKAKLSTKTKYKAPSTKNEFSMRQILLFSSVLDHPHGDAARLAALGGLYSKEPASST
jgi:hypothetical protein